MSEKTARTTRVIRAYKDLLNKLGRNPTKGELIHATGLSRSTIGDIISREGLYTLPYGSLTDKGVNSMALKKKDVVQIVQAERKAHKVNEQHVLLRRKYQILQREHSRLEREFSAISTHMGRDIIPKQIRLSDKRNVNEAVPIIVLSDWHVEEEVKPHTVGGKNKYNLDIAKKRANKVFTSSLSLIREKEDDVTIKNIGIFLLGDFITGNIHAENMENALLGPLDALAYAQELIESGLDFLLEHTDKKLTIYCKVGNHSRITKKVHISTEWENSLELAMYWSLMRRYKERAPDRVDFHIEKSYLSVAKILNYPVRFHHGHAVSYGGGVGGLHIPLRKAIHNWNQNQKAAVDIIGHYHNFAEYSTLKYLVNGSLIGYSAYAERIKAVSEPPVQGFALLHKKYGFTSLTPIFAE